MPPNLWMKNRQPPGRPRVCVDIVAPARLHLGFLDLNGGLGRRFGSLGLAIDAFATRLRAERAPGFAAAGAQSQRALGYARDYARARGLPGGVDLRIDESIPSHAGLGSGTQMALAVGTALARLYSDPRCEPGTDSRAIAETLGRGQRSGIGIGTFDQGGFIVDCGRGERGGVPPVALRIHFPEDWRILLLLDQRGPGIHGEQERHAFARLPAADASTAGRLCRVLLMQIVPGLLDADLDPVAAGIGEIQRAVGAHFAPAQGGCFASPAVAAAIDWAGAQGLPGSGQSSWGPTGFVLTRDEDQARWLELGLKRRFGEVSPLRTRICAARNRGASVALDPGAAQERAVHLAPTAVQPRREA